MFNNSFYKIGFLLIFLSFFFFPIFSFAQEECQTLKECESQLSIIQERIKQLEKIISNLSKEKKTRQNQIELLKAKINTLELQIKETNLKIKNLNFQIKDTLSSIEFTNAEIEKEKEKLAEILRTIYEESQTSIIEILFSQSTLASFFDKLVGLETFNKVQKGIIEEIKELKQELEKKKATLEDQKAELERLLNISVLQKQENEKTKREQEELLKMNETQYQQYLKEKKELEKRASELMQRIAQLSLPGLAVPRDKGELYKLANWVEKLTGVRSALILALIEVESALGTNVGQCNCLGQPICKNPQLSYKQVMPSSHWEAFEEICKELGLNPNTTPVSCYINGGKVQMGGAMGPAQFMPNTWLKYKERIENLTGVKPANPWRASDAFLAAGLYLADWGASNQNPETEKGAVTAYLCGTSIMTPSCQRAGGEWYRNLVIQKAKEWEEWIKANF